MKNKTAVVMMNVSETLKKDVVELANKMNRSQTNIFENCFHHTRLHGILRCSSCQHPLCFKMEIDYLKLTVQFIKCSNCHTVTNL